MIRRREKTHWFRRALSAIASRELAAALALVGSLGWLHNVVGDLTAHTTDNTAEAAQLRADLREMRLELANCGRH